MHDTEVMPNPLEVLLSPFSCFLSIRQWNSVIYTSNIFLIFLLIGEGILIKLGKQCWRELR